MPSEQQTNVMAPEASNTLISRWRNFQWWHDDDYVANDKPNFLAVLEIAAAIFFYGGIAFYFQTPWSLIIPIVMAPLLLLRSESSIQRGLELLKIILNFSNPGNKKAWVIGGVATIICVAMTYWVLDKLMLTWLNGRSGWALFWRSGVIGVIGLTGVGAGAIVGVLTGRGMGASVSTPATTETVAESIGGSSTAALVLMAFFIPGGVIGLCIQGLLIRLRATLSLKHLVAGMAAFSQNWRETVLISNMRHAPALIPRAGSIDPSLNVSTLIKSIDSHWIEKLNKFLLVPAITLMATLYRWNIKASFFIWAPIALGLSPTLWPCDPDTPNTPSEKRRTDSTKWTNNWAIGLLGTFCLYIAGWVALTSYKLLNDDIQKALPDWTSVFYKYLSIPQVGLRLTLAILFLLSLTWLLKVAYGMHADYFEELNNSKAYAEMSPQVENGFHAAAKRVARWRKITQMMGVLMIYAFLLTLAIVKLPNSIAFKYLRPLENWL